MQNPDGIKTEKKLHCSSRSEKTEAGCSFLLYEIAGSKANLPEIAGSKANLPGIAGEKASSFVNLKISRHDTRADPRCYPGRLRCDPRISRMFPGWHSRRLYRMVPSY